MFKNTLHKTLTNAAIVRFQIKKASTLSVLGQIEQFAAANPNAIAILDHLRQHTYSEVCSKSNSVAKSLSDERICNENVTFLCQNDASFAITQLGIWKSGNCGVPLCKNHPANALDYYIRDSDAKILIASQQYVEKVYPLVKGIRKLLVYEEISEGSPSSVGLVNEKRIRSKDAIVIYTSGTTGSPKGVVATHEILQAQVENLQKAWHYSQQDCLLHVLPLHHTHGIVNCLLCPLTVGGKVKMMKNFDPHEVWQELLCDNDSADRVNIFMAVPTIYAKLIDHFHKNINQGKFLGKSLSDIREICRREIRLMVSGSAALPEPIFTEWEKLSSHVLLERYGMTEIGMALTNPVDVRGRRPGFVGMPFPSVKARIVNEGTNEILVEASCDDIRILKGGVELSGELQIKGPNVFSCYFRRREATLKEFTADDWFKTGDMAKVENGSFKILGRSSVDIIKSGGYKISALDIERVLLSHESILEVAVVGIDDGIWGQIVGAVVALNSDDDNLDLKDLQEWCSNWMPHYQIPRRLKVVQQLPRNLMGKINKKELVSFAFPVA